MEEELVNYIEAPWDCQDLDPYRDDPKGDGGREVIGSDRIVDSREEPGAVDTDRPLCTCGGGCPEEMPTREEQLCCREVKTWQSEQSKGENQFPNTDFMPCVLQMLSVSWSLRASRMCAIEILTGAGHILSFTFSLFYSFNPDSCGKSTAHF
jgi:hypothetical protein